MNIAIYVLAPLWGVFMDLVIGRRWGTVGSALWTVLQALLAIWWQLSPRQQARVLAALSTRALALGRAVHAGIDAVHRFGARLGDACFYVGGWLGERAERLRREAESTDGES